MTAPLGDAGAFARLDRARFYAAIRPLFGTLTQAQVDGIGRLLDAFLLYALILDRRHLAYILATSFHETGQRMQPVREGFAKSTAEAIAFLDRAWAAGKLKSVKTPYWRAGWFGRGDVQLTHEANYATMGKLIGVDLVAAPDRALDPAISARILVEGITRGVSVRGDFTGKALEDFIVGDRCDYVGARRTVNGTDKAEMIAGYARKFEAALLAGGMPLTAVRLPLALGVQPALAPAPAAAAVPAPTASLKVAFQPGSGLWAWIKSKVA